MFENCFIRSFRLRLRDRLGAVEYPLDIVDVIRGWKTLGVGDGYGNGYTFEVLKKWMKNLVRD